MKHFAFLAAAAVLPACTTAHYLFPHLILNGQVTQPFEYVREHDNGFQPSWDDGRFLQSKDIRCNKGSENHMTAPKTAKVVAGKDTIGFASNVGTHLQHPGPLTVYLSKAPGDVKQYDGSGDWFKVFQLGTKSPWDGNDKGWLTWDKQHFTFKLPAEIPAGQYLMRVEHIATHPPYSAKQFFLQCAHLDIQSSYVGAAPSPTIKFPGGYSMQDPAIKFDSWAKPIPTLYSLPGPKMWPNNNMLNYVGGTS
ncbi:fungal cellulose binding domain-containing protein [Clohesyomyces aquaticus]|uniref:AA9 family lytic polysaccharide monooxygenase n=1 Tax=Clohesyomyces aquaticus TaxID=1231657 RepID=A0A1Y1YFU8_9PLEO|nr:fungal cellulose binding domain-containing protein [Clohesyomyces aquaticus]